MLSATYQNITKEALCAALHVSDAQLAGMTAPAGWKDNGTVITFPITEENQVCSWADAHVDARVWVGGREVFVNMLATRNWPARQLFIRLYY